MNCLFDFKYEVPINKHVLLCSLPVAGLDLVKGKVHQSQVHDRRRLRKVPGWGDHRHGPKHGPILGPDRGHISRKVKLVFIHRRLIGFCNSRFLYKPWCHHTVEIFFMKSGKCVCPCEHTDMHGARTVCGFKWKQFAVAMYSCSLIIYDYCLI